MRHGGKKLEVSLVHFYCLRTMILGSKTLLKTQKPPFLEKDFERLNAAAVEEIYVEVSLDPGSHGLILPSEP